MATCEKCWGRAFTRAYSGPTKSQADCYADILKERDEAGLVCTPEERAGRWWDKRRQVDTRLEMT